MCRKRRLLRTTFPAANAAPRLVSRGFPQFLPHYYDYYDVLYNDRETDGRATGVDT
jgi:hypothetical protein